MAENLGPRPHAISSGDEFLNLLLTQAEQTNDLLGRIIDRLPEPAPVAAGEPGRVELREPALQHQPEPAADDTPPAPPDSEPKNRRAPGRRSTKTTKE